MAKIADLTGCYAILFQRLSVILTFMPTTHDRLDRAILARLQQDGRIANIDLAEAVSLSPSACLRRVKALEASGIIEGYRAEVSRPQAGLGLTAFIGLRVENHSRAASRDIEDGLTAIPAVVACYVTSGEDDFFVEIAARDLADYERILLDLILAVPGVGRARTTFAIRTVLSRGPVPLTHWR
jgi:Lrp/AsnC family transcriptional regulator, leucine-responsive regulatory protein